MVKNPPASAGDIRDACSIPGLGRSPGVGHGNPLQYSCLENSTDRGARWATVHRVRKSGHDRSNLTHTRAEIGRLLWYAGTYLRVSKVKKKQNKTQASKQEQSAHSPVGATVVAFPAFHSANTITTANASCLNNITDVRRGKRCTAAHYYILFHSTDTRATDSLEITDNHKI